MSDSGNAAAQRRRKLLFCLFAVWLIWGGSYAVTKVGVQQLPPFLFGGLRFASSGLLLLGIAWLLGNRPRFNARELRNIAWVAFGSVLLSNGSNVWSMQWMASNRSALLNATAVLWIVSLSSFGRRAQALDGRTLLGLAAGFAGTVMVIGGGASTPVPVASLLWWPEIITLVGVLGWAFATVYMRNQQSQMDILSFTGAQMLLGGIALSAIGLGLGESQRWQWTTQGFLAFLYMLVLSSLVGYTAYAWLAKHASPAVVGSYSYINPGMAALLGWWLLDESLTRWQLAGMFIMLAGVALSGWPRGKTASGTTANEGHSA